MATSSVGRRPPRGPSARRAALGDPRGLRRREQAPGRDPARDRRAELRDAGVHHRGGARSGRRAGSRGYTPNGGYLSLRELLAGRSSGSTATRSTRTAIVVTPGAMNALFSIYLALLEPGDEVLLPTPGFPNMDEMVRLLGGEPVFYRLRPCAATCRRASEIEALVTSRTKAIFVNSPGNPTGAVFPRRDGAGARRARRRARHLADLRRGLRRADPRRRARARLGGGARAGRARGLGLQLLEGLRDDRAGGSATARRRASSRTCCASCRSRRSRARRRSRRRRPRRRCAARGKSSTRCATPTGTRRDRAVEEAATARARRCSGRRAPSTCSSTSSACGLRRASSRSGCWTSSTSRSRPARCSAPAATGSCASRSRSRRTRSRRASRADRASGRGLLGA